MPGKLCFPGGHLDEGLTLLQNAKKELEEETGIVATHLTKVENHTFETGDSTTIFYCFEHIKIPDGSIFKNCLIETGFPLLTIDEHSTWMFVTLNEFFDNKIQKQLMPGITGYMNQIFPEYNSKSK
jgi:8-oxo-dGTP pyrophosphatase MutT (NUDIX family)